MKKAEIKEVYANLNIRLFPFYLRIFYDINILSPSESIFKTWDIDIFD